MGFISVVLVLFVISFNCNIKSSDSRKNDNLEAKNFISLSPKTIEQRPCICVMPTVCSCCEIVTIFYTRDERRLCFNMAYSRNGLNVDLSLDTTIISSMAVANYRPFRMCSSVPGLLLSSICVNISDLNQLANTIVICPRLEISTKIKRWQIGYLCQNISTMLPAGIAPLMGSGSTGIQVIMMPTAMVPAPAPNGMMVVMPPVAGGGIIMPGPAPGAIPPITGLMMMAMRLATMPTAVPPATTPAAATTQRPPAAPALPGGTPSAGAVVPRPTDALLYNLEPLFRLELVDPSDNSTAGLSNPALPNSMLLPLEPDQFEQRSSNENDTDFSISDNAKQVEFNKTIDDKISTIEDTTESNTSSESAESKRISKRTKRQLDIFDIFRQSNRCDRAYRICITRSNNYIISKLRTTRFNDNINENMQCNERPTKIVHTSGENLCSYLTTAINNDSGSSSSSTQSSSSNSDSLDAIIVHDDSDDDSTFYSQNYPQIASIVPYNRPRIYPARAPPQIFSELQEQLKNLTNDAIKISHLK